MGPEDPTGMMREMEAIMDGGGHDGLSASLSSGALSSGAGSDVEQRKLVILGLPWDTSEDTLQRYFSQYGLLEDAMIMRDRYSGKSRGFGFVTYLYRDDAQRVVASEHSVDGRRCEAKFALPRGGSNPNRTTRIFVARIPPTVSDHHFRAYFERFGPVQDAYMPKDASKSGHRGIGFVTFTCTESVEKVMSTTHRMNGQELAIDRATPKAKAEEARRDAGTIGALRPLQPGGGGAFSPGFPGLYSLQGGMMAGYGTLAGLSYANGAQLLVQALAGGSPGSSGRYASMNGDSPTHNGYNGGGGSGGLNGASSQACLIDGNSLAGALAGISTSSGELDLSRVSSGSGASILGTSAGRGGVPGSVQALQGLPGLQGSGDGIGISIGLQHLAAVQARGGGSGGSNGGGGHNLSLGMELSGSVLRAMAANAQQVSGAMETAMQMLPPGAGNGAADGHLVGNGHHSHPSHLAGLPLGGGGRHHLGPGSDQLGGLPSSHSSERSLQGLGGLEQANAGPRIFVGKLNKDTTETDVRDYFTRFGYVMDVYMPRDKSNRSEHRGFGFVTFETNAAVLRVASHGTHMIKGSVIAIDSAVPRREEGARMADENDAMNHHGGGGPGSGGFGDLVDPGNDLGPSRHHSAERGRQGYKPY